MHKTLPLVGAASLLAVAMFVVPLGAQAKAPATWIGRVDHVSTQNIKVTDSTGHTQSFLLVPRFNQVFSDEGKTTAQMTQIKPGMWVKIFYDQKLIGARHADKIWILRGRHAVKGLKS
jgi:hypothetical protein